MATIKKRGDLQWRVQIRKKGFPPQSKTFMNRSDAEKWARSVESEMDRGIFLPRSDAERTIFQKVSARFREEFAPHHYRIREDGKESWKFQLNKIENYFGSYSMAAITPQTVSKYREARLTEVGNSTVRKELYLLSKVIGVAAKEFGIVLPHGNPVKNVRLPRENKGRDRRLTSDELNALLNECKNSRNAWLYPVVNLAIETAMRQGEILALEWKDVDMPRRFALLHEGETKNGSSRAVPLSSESLRILKGLAKTNSSRVFPQDRMTITNAFKAACKRAHVNDFHFHDLRHEALSKLAERGDMSVLELAAVSGHKTLQMLKRYTHLQAEKLAYKIG